VVSNRLLLAARDHLPTSKSHEGCAALQNSDLNCTEFSAPYVIDHEDRLGLCTSAEFIRFIERGFAFAGIASTSLNRCCNTVSNFRE
jgi:hypothetical protein